MNPNTPTESTEREKFEAWCVKNRLRTDRQASPSGLTDVYLDSDVDWMWEGWKGRAALLPPVVAESGPAHADSVEASSVPAAALPTWQPIETAPKDGREVVLAVAMRAGIRRGVLVGHYLEGGHCIEDHPAIDAGWYFWNGCMFDEASKPTHWMPLPHHPEWEPGGWQARKNKDLES